MKGDAWKFLYVDWSGDTGFKFREHSSRRIAIAAAACETPEIFSELAASVRERKRLDPGFEFRFSRTSDGVRIAFFDALALLDFAAYVVVADKTRLPPFFRRLRGYHFIQSLLAELVVGIPRDHVEGANLIFDGQRDEVSVIRRMRVAVSQRLKQKGRGYFLKKVTARPSHEVSGLQVADMLAGAAVSASCAALLKGLRQQVEVRYYGGGK